MVLNQNLGHSLAWHCTGKMRTSPRKHPPTHLVRGSVFCSIYYSPVVLTTVPSNSEYWRLQFEILKLVSIQNGNIISEEGQPQVSILAFHLAWDSVFVVHYSAHQASWPASFQSLSCVCLPPDGMSDMCLDYTCAHIYACAHWSCVAFILEKRVFTRTEQRNLVSARR